MPFEQTPSNVSAQPPGSQHTAPQFEERFFLEGPQSRAEELWRVLRIAREFFMGFRTLHFVGPCVSVFGSARFQEDHPYYSLARHLGARLGQMGFTIGPEDLNLLFLTDSVEEAAGYIHTSAIERLGLRTRRVPKRSRLLRE